MNALVTALPGPVIIFRFGRRSERLSRRLVIEKICFTKLQYLYVRVLFKIRLELQ